MAAGKLWQLAICTPLASCVAVNELHTVGKLYTAGELCGSGRAVWQWASCVAVDKLCGSGQAVWGVWAQPGIRPGISVDVRLAYRTYLPPQKGETLGPTKLDASHLN